MNTHFNVVIATPGWSMDYRYVMSLLHTIKLLEEQKISWAYTSRQCSDVSLAREWTILSNPIDNAILDKKMAFPLSGLATYDKLFLIDSDIYWDPQDFLKLYVSNFDAVSGVYKQSDGRNTTLYVEGKHLLTVDELNSKDTPFEIIGAGLGFMCVKTGVFESTPRPWFQHIVEEHEDLENPYLEIYSEDISFVQKVIQSGYKVYADPTCRVGHTKLFELGW